MIQPTTPIKPPFNDALYRALAKEHSLEHYMRKPLIEQGLRLKLGLPEHKGEIPKEFNVEVR